MSEVGSGVLQGGWEFVTAAYAVTAVVLVSYALSVVARYRTESRRREREARPGVKP
jgi:heme exporter protein D